MKLSLKQVYSFFILTLFLIATSCQKQVSPEIARDEVRGSREIERLDACAKVNFNKGVLLYQNVGYLFVCMKWDVEFPHMFDSIKKIRAASWDHLMAPIDQTFITNQKSRNRIFKYIHDLDAKGGLDDLSYVLVALNETNFFDSIKAMFTCVDDPGNLTCSNRTGKIPSKASLMNILKIIDSNPDTIDNLSTFVKHLIKAIGGKQEDIRLEINKFRASPFYIPLRLKLVDSLADKVKSGFTEDDRRLLSKILLTANRNGDALWIYQWVQDLKMNRAIFRDLIEYPVLTNPDFISEIKGVKKLYDNGLFCTIKSTTSPNNLIDFDLKTQLFAYTNNIKTNSQKAFFEYSSENLLGLKISVETCSELEKNKYNVNLNQALFHLVGFLSEKKFYDLIKFLINNTTAKGDLDKTFAENIYLADFAAGDIFTSANGLNSAIVSKTRNFYPLVYDVIKSLPQEGYSTLGEFTASLMEAENDERFRGVADFWNFFTLEEKNFLFNFLDRHFDKDVDYVLLFDFYTKFFDEIRDVQPILRDSWIGDSNKAEMSYLTLQDILSNFAGKETLLDFKRFFSRDQILKVLEVISNGNQINQAAREEIEYNKSDNYVNRTRSEKYKFKIKYDQENEPDYDSKLVLDCMQKFADVQNGFYELVRHLPEACTKVTEANISFRLFGWLNSIEETYLKFKNAETNQDSLFDQNGILSPYMLNTTIGLTKILDNLIGPPGGPLPSKSGISYLLNSTNYYLNKKNAAPLIDKNIEWLSSLANVSANNNILHRNALVKSFTRVDNFSYSKTVINNLGKLSLEYGDWVKTGELAKAQSRSLGGYDPNYDCQKVINQFIAPNPCPSKEIVKQYGNDILFLMQNAWEKQQGSPVSLLLKAAKSGEGIDIPLNGKQTKKYRLSLKETFRYMYDTSDKSFPVNNIKVNFVNEAGKASEESVTSLERIESVIREVRFGNNYLGVAFLNAIVHGDDYNSDVVSRKKLLQKCIKIPGIRCGKKMSDSDIRMTLNSLNVYDALSDVNNGRNLDKRLQYGDFLKTFEQTLVGSSAIAAQKVQLLPLKDEALLKHNGKILSDMTVMTTWSNTARVIRDRIGRTRLDFDNFINREDFKRVDRALLAGFDLPTATIAAQSILDKIRKVPNGEKQNLFENTIDWVAGLNYDETRLVEDTLARLMVVGSYLGTPEFVFKKEGFDQLSQRYADNNIFQFFLALDKIIDYWPTLKNYFPSNVKLIDAIKPINTALFFLTTKLNSTTDPQKNTAYLALNDLFQIFQTILFDKLPSPLIGGDKTSTTQGLDIVVEFLKDSGLVNSTYSVLQSDYRFVDILHENNAEWFFAIGQNLKRTALSPDVDLTPIRDFLAFTSKNLICLSGEASCKKNYHFDEPTNLILFLNKKADSGQSHFILLNQKVFKENIDQVTQIIDDLLPAIRIKEVRVPMSYVLDPV